MFPSLCKRNESGNIEGNAFLAAYGENNHRLPAITVMSCPRPPAVTKNLCLKKELRLYRNHSERILTCQWDMRSFFFCVMLFPMLGRGRQIPGSPLTQTATWKFV